MNVGSTYLQIVNKVLIRLREAEVADFSSPTGYTELVMDVVNQAKAEIEEAYEWHALRDTYTVSTEDGTVSYAMTGAGSRARVLGGYNSTRVWELSRATSRFFDDQYFNQSTVQTGSPTHFIENGFDASYDLKVDVWPKPTSVETLTFNLYVPQAALSATSDVPLIPVVPLIEGALAHLIAERGDDGGIAAQAQEMRYQRTLADAVAVEAGRHPDALVWVPV
jgi:hypothetical protein